MLLQQRGPSGVQMNACASGIDDVGKAKTVRSEQVHANAASAAPIYTQS